MKKYILLAPFFAPLVAFCGNTLGTIGQIQVGTTDPNLAFITPVGSNASLPSCSTAGNRYAIDLTTNAGKAAYAAALTAKLTNSTITLVGSGTCTLNVTSENLSSIQLQ